MSTESPRIIHLRDPPPTDPDAVDAIPVWLPGDPCHSLGWAADLATWDGERRVAYEVEVTRWVEELHWNEEPARFLAWDAMRGMEKKGKSR